jgi:hypothetical protein
MKPFEETRRTAALRPAASGVEAAPMRRYAWADAFVSHPFGER